MASPTSSTDGPSATQAEPMELDSLSQPDTEATQAPIHPEVPSSYVAEILTDDDAEEFLADAPDGVFCAPATKEWLVMQHGERTVPDPPVGKRRRRGPTTQIISHTGAASSQQTVPRHSAPTPEAARGPPPEADLPWATHGPQDLPTPALDLSFFIDDNPENIPRITWKAFCSHVGIQEPRWAASFLNYLCAEFRKSGVAALPDLILFLAEEYQREPYLYLLHTLAPEWRPDFTGFPSQGDPQKIESHYLVHLMVHECRNTPKDWVSIVRMVMEDRRHFATTRKALAASMNVIYPLDVKAKLWD